MSRLTKQKIQPWITVGFSWPELEREEQRARDKCHKAMRKAHKAAQAGAVLEMTPIIVASTLDSRAWAISASIVITLFKEFVVY